MRRFPSLAAAATLSAAVLLGLPDVGGAHDMEKGPHGGQMIESKGHHLEMVVTGNQIEIFVSDAAHAPIASTGATGRAVILAGKEQKTVPLTVKPPNALAANLDTPLAPGARVVVSAKLAGGQDLLARFVAK
jgi:hypothetical protein